MGKFVLFSMLFASFAADDQQFPVFGGFSELSEDSFKASETKIRTAFDLLNGKYPYMGFNFKRIVSGKSQVVVGSHSVFQIEVTTQYRVMNCELDIYENLKGEVYQVEIKYCGSFSYVKPE